MQPVSFNFKAQTESEGMEIDIPGKWKPKEEQGLLFLYQKKIDFKSKNVTREKAHHDIVIKRLICGI